METTGQKRAAEVDLEDVTTAKRATRRRTWTLTKSCDRIYKHTEDDQNSEWCAGLREVRAGTTSRRLWMAWQEMAPAAAGEPTELRQYRGYKTVTNNAKP